MKLFLKIKLLPYLVFAFHRLVSSTWRLKHIVHPDLEKDLSAGQAATLAHWHMDETVLVLSIKKLRAGILNSKSSDGQMMAKVVKLYGAKTAKGSSSRDGVEALKGLIRLGKSGYNPTIAVDGPRGPFKQIKPGVFQVSRLCKAKIYPASVCYKKAWHFPKSWDKTYFPKPFSKVLILWGSPMSLVDKKQDPKDPQLAKSLEEQFKLAETQALKLFTSL